MDQTPPPPQSIPPPQPAIPTPPPPLIVPVKPKNTLVTALIVLIVLLSLGAAGYFAYQYMQQKQQAAITTFEECSKAPGSVMEAMYPPVCVTRNGKSFTQPLTPEEQQNLQPPDLTTESTGSAVTADWKTYTNTTYQYQLQYPPELIHESSNYSVSNSQVSVETFNFPDKTTAISIISYDSTINPNLEFNAAVESENTISIASQNVKQIRGKESVSDTGTLIHVGPIVQNKNLHMITYSSGSSVSKQENEQLFNQILSTFTFTNQPAGTQTTSGTGCEYKGKTYANGAAVPSGDTCNSCSCDNGQVACTTMACQ